MKVENSDMFESFSACIPESPKQMDFRVVSFCDISKIFKDYHYKSDHMGGGISFCFASSFKGVNLAGMVVGGLRHEKKYSNEGKAVELRRMACHEMLPHNSESWFIGCCLRWLKKNTDIKKVISYSDLSVGHIGTIYKASNFKLIGETAPSKHVFWNGKRYHPRSLTIERDYSYRLRKAVKNGDAKIETGKPKLIFEYKF